jgi:hypothetical protein
MIRLRHGGYVLVLGTLLVTGCGDDGGEPDLGGTQTASSAASTGGSSAAASSGNGGGGSEAACGDDEDNLDGSCSRTIHATLGATASGNMRRSNEGCPLDVAESPPDPGAPGTNTWVLEALLVGKAGSTHVRSSSYLTFDTSSLAAEVAVDGAELRVYHESAGGVPYDVGLVGGDQPIFGDALDVDDFDAGVLPPLDVRPMADILRAGYAAFAVPANQINLGGLSQFALHFDLSCADFEEPTADSNFWLHHHPGTRELDKRPVLVVTYRP